MRAATVTEFGGPEVLSVLVSPDPEPGVGDVLIAVEAADTLWVETAIRSGDGVDFWPMRPPYVPGNGVAGRVASVGSGVDASWIGRRVAAHTGNENGYADHAVVPAASLSPIPDELTTQAAAALLHDGPTALALFDITQVGAGDELLVIGASGGLGLLSVQLGRARGARVVAVARGPKLARVEALRPDVVIDSDGRDWVERAREALPNGADVILDNVGGPLGESAFSLIADGGRFSAHGTPGGRFADIDPDEAQRRGVVVTGIESVQMGVEDIVRRTDQAFAEAAAGHLAPVVGQTFALDDAASAHAAIEGREVFGTTLLLP